MKSKLYIAGLLLLFALPLAAQQAAETTLRIEQIEPLPVDHFIVGTGSGNSTLEATAANIAVVAQNGLSSTDVQAALEELQGEIIGGGDGWGSDVVNTSNEFTGDGTVGDPLTLAPGNINTSELNNDAGFLTTDESVNTAAFTGVGTKTLTLGRVIGVDLTAQFTDEVNDADANASNELQNLTISNGVATLDQGGGNIEIFDPFTEEDFYPTSGSTVTISASPNTTSPYYVQVWRGGLAQSVAFSGSASDVTVSSTTVTFNYRALESGEHVKVRYIQQ